MTATATTNEMMTTTKSKFVFRPTEKALLFSKIDCQPARSENSIVGNLYVRKDGIIVKAVHVKSNIRLIPACVLCLEKHANYEYEELCKYTRIRQYKKDSFQIPGVFLCIRHSHVDTSPRVESLPIGLRQLQLDDIPTELPKRMCKNTHDHSRKKWIFKCTLCPVEKFEDRKHAQPKLDYLMCHTCYNQAIAFGKNCPNSLPDWIWQMYLARFCDSCSTSKAHTKPGELCRLCQKNDKFEPDPKLLKRIQKYSKKLTRSVCTLKGEAEALGLLEKKV